MPEVSCSLDETVEKSYNTNDNMTFTIDYSNTNYLFNTIKIKSFENALNIDILIKFTNEDMLKEGERKNYKNTVGIGKEYFFLFDFFKNNTILSKKEINNILYNQIYVRGGTVNHMCFIKLPINYLKIANSQ